MRKTIAVLAATVALTVVPSATAVAQGDAQCIDVTIQQTPPGGYVSAPYPCGCGRTLTVTPIAGGAIYTINMGCPRL